MFVFGLLGLGGGIFFLECVICFCCCFLRDSRLGVEGLLLGGGGCVFFCRSIRYLDLSLEVFVCVNGCLGVGRVL